MEIKSQIESLLFIAAKPMSVKQLVDIIKSKDTSTSSAQEQEIKKACDELVEDYKENELLRLVSEMKLPGRAWLEFKIQEKNDNTLIEQTAIFDPVGLFGLLYWYILYPIHSIMFSGMIRNIVAKAETVE